MSRGKYKSTDVPRAQRPRHVDGLDINPVEDGFMIYRPDTDRVHYLNHTAVLILELSNGRHTPARIASLLKNAYGLPQAPEREVKETLLKMADEGLIRGTSPGRTRPRNAPRTRRRR